MHHFTKSYGHVVTNEEATADCQVIHIHAVHAGLHSNKYMKTVPFSLPSTITDIHIECFLVYDVKCLLIKNNERKK